MGTDEDLIDGLAPSGQKAKRMAEEHGEHPQDPLELAYIAACPLCYREGLE